MIFVHFRGIEATRLWIEFQWSYFYFWRKGFRTIRKKWNLYNRRNYGFNHFKVVPYIITIITRYRAKWDIFDFVIPSGRITEVTNWARFISTIRSIAWPKWSLLTTILIASKKMVISLDSLIIPRTEAEHMKHSDFGWALTGSIHRM